MILVLHSPSRQQSNHFVAKCCFFQEKFIMSFLRGDLLSRMRCLIKGRIRNKPKWFEAVEKVPPEPVRRRCKKAPKIILPEDTYVEAYYARHPEAKMIPFQLNSFDPPIARRFAWRQMELIEQGHTRKEARDLVEVEFDAISRKEEEEYQLERKLAIQEGRQPLKRKNIIDEVQDQEWEAMKHGLEVLAEQKSLKEI